MTAYVLAGLVSGSIYALTALGLVSTYLSAGVLNFSYGAYAFFAASCYYFLHSQHHWGIAVSAVLVVLVISPLLGLGLWAVLFRGLARSTTLIKVAATIGLSVAFPPVAQILFGKPQVYGTPPGLAPQPVAVYHVLGVAITMDQAIVLACLAAVLVIGGVVLRFTGAGLVVRAVVDSEKMAALTGVSPQRVSAAVWAFSYLLAGLAGVLVAPILGLGSDGFTFLMATAFTAVVIARLRHPGRAVVVALLIGVATSLVQKWAPPSSTLAQDLVPAVPFLFVFVFILLGSRRVTEERGDHEARLGAALAGEDERHHRRAQAAGPARRRYLAAPAAAGRAHAGLIVTIVVLAVLPAVLNSYWVGLVGFGAAMGVALLSFTLVTGEGGLISLAQVSFAGIGSAAVAQFTTVNGLPALLALALAGLVALPFGLVVGLLTVRLGDLYVALITLTFALLMDSLAFDSSYFFQNGLGVNASRPSFAGGGASFAYFALVIFALLALFLVSVRRSTTGLAVVAARWSVPGARTIGLSTTAVRVQAMGVSAVIAAIGGGLLAMYQYASLLNGFSTGQGLVWLAVAVAVGIRSPLGALLAGLAFAVVPGIFTQYLPASWTPVPTLLFGLAAIGMVRQPDGLLADIGGLAHWLGRRAAALLAHGPAGPGGPAARVSPPRPQGVTR
jgi:branched-chain amino acid transport system permease protein